MEVLLVNKHNLKEFIDFPDRLYANDGNYVPYIKSDLKKTLNKLLFIDKTYTALIVKSGNETLARILFTIDKNKQLDTLKCGFFTMFECVNDQTVCNELLNKTVEILKLRGAEYISGTYFPHDQDNRRGILVQGFDRAPLIFTSYNKPYYHDLLSNFGLKKQTDALEYSLDLEVADYARLRRIRDFTQAKFNFRIDTVNWKQIDKDIDDVHTVMEQATNEIIYQEAPSIEALQSIVKGWKKYLNKDYILIARSNKDDSPLGVVMAIPDFFQAFKKMRGKTDLKGLIAFAREKRRIRSVRAILQYVLPQYQNLGVSMALYCKMFEALVNNKAEYLEAGTIMENNKQSNDAIASVGGKIARVYRIYQMKL